MPSCDRLKQFVRQERILVNNAKRAPAIADYFAATKIPRFGGELWWIESPHALMETKHTKDCHLLVWDMHWQAYSDALIEALMVDVRVVGWEQRLKSNLAAIELVFATEQGLCAYYPDTSFSSHFIDIMCGRDIENIHVSRIDFETTTDKKTLLMLQILVQSLTLFHEATHILYEYDSSFRSSAIEVIQGMAAQLKENLVTKQEDVHLEKRIFQIIDGIANPRISGINNSEFVCDFMAIAWFYDWIADHSYTRQKDASYFILGPLAIQMYFFSLRFFEQIRSDVVKLSRGKLQFIRHPESEWQLREWMSKKFQVVIWEKTLKEARAKFESNLQDEDIIELRVCKKTVLRNFRQKHRVATERHLLDLNSNNFLGLCYPYALNGAQRSSDEILRYLGWN